MSEDPISNKIAIGMILTLMGKLTDEERIDIMSHFCQGCGTKDLPCFCMRDD